MNKNGKKKYFIFDLDETLYKYTDSYTVVNIIDKSLFRKLSSQGNIIIFSNATYSHCSYWCDILDIKQYINTILSCDIIKEVKPNPLSYKKAIKLLGIKKDESVYFFDDQSINLYTPSKDYNWNTILINKSYKIIKNIPTDYINAKYDNINEALNDYINGYIKCKITSN